MSTCLLNINPCSCFPLSGEVGLLLFSHAHPACKWLELSTCILSVGICILPDLILQGTAGHGRNKKQIPKANCFT